MSGLVAAALLAACGANPRVAADPSTRSAATTAAAATTPTTAPSAPAVPATGAPGATASTATAPATTPSTQPTGGPVTIAFAGDVHGESPIAGVLSGGGNPLGAMADVLTAADLAVVNLETTIGDQGTPQQKRYVFRSTPSLLSSIKAAGVDVVSVANNHSYDTGRAGFLETMRQIGESGLVGVGGGANADEAYRAYTTTINGTRVAIVGLSKVGPEDPNGRAAADRPGVTNARDLDATLAAIRSAKASADVVVAFLHWGVELATCPQVEDRSLAQQLLDAGASAVVGAHPHVLQGIKDTPDHKLVAYSLGNFVFYAKRDVARDTGVLTVTFNGDGTVASWTFAPARIAVGTGSPSPITDEATRQAKLDRLAALTPGDDRGECG